MHIAAQKNHLSICWLLLTQNVPDFKNMNQIKDCDVILNQISPILQQVDKWGNTPLHTAASNGHKKLVKWFLDVGSDRRIKNIYNFTPLDVASNNDCRKLLHCQYDHIPAKSDSNSNSHSFSHNAEKVKLFLQKYLDFRTKLMTLISSNNNIESVNDIGDTVTDTNITNTTTTYDSPYSISDLNGIQDLIENATDFGLTRDVIDKSLQHLKWLKVKRKMWEHIQDVKDNAPIITSTKYSFVNDLKRMIHDVWCCDNGFISDMHIGDADDGNDQIGSQLVSKTTCVSAKICDDNKDTLQQQQQTAQLPTQQVLPPCPPLLTIDIEKIIKIGLSLCDQSTAEFNLHKACQECQKLSFATVITEHDDNDVSNDTNINAGSNRRASSTSTNIMVDLLQKTIYNAKKVNADNKLIEECELLYSRILSERSLLEARNSIPRDIKLPPPAETPMTSKQAKLYWVDVIDIGYIKETEGYPLPPSLSEGHNSDDINKTAISSDSNSNLDKVGDYIWIKSKSLQLLEEALIKTEQCIKDAISFGANNELIESCQKLLKEKRDNDLKVLLEKDQVDRLAALTTTEKAAKKLLKKKKKKKGSSK